MAPKVSPYAKKAKNEGRQTVAIPESLMSLVDLWSEQEVVEGREPPKSRNDAVNRIVRLATEKFNQTKKENGTK